MESKVKTLFSVKDLVERWSLSRSKIYQMLDAGTIPSVKAGNNRRVTIEAVRAFEASLSGSQA